MCRKFQGPRTRGIALWEDRVIANLPDGRVIAIDRDNGEIVWDKRVAGKNEFGGSEEFFTAPIVVDGKVLVHNGAGDGGTRGWLAALDVKTGEEVWRFFVVPKEGDPGSETWKDNHNAWKTGGGGIWQTGSYDPATKLYIVGTGNPYPIYDPQFRPGDNLYTNSAIAINVDTGKLAWHFQYTPNDSWDFDEVGVHMLYDVKDRRRRAQSGRALRTQWLLLHPRSHERQLHQGREVRQRSELDQGHRPEDRQTDGVRPEAGRPTVQSRRARLAW